MPTSCLDKYNYLQDTWQKNGMTVFEGFLQCYNNKDFYKDEKPLSGVVAETMNLWVIHPIDIRSFDRSRHKITKDLNDEKTRKAIN